MLAGTLARHWRALPSSATPTAIGNPARERYLS